MANFQPTFCLSLLSLLLLLPASKVNSQQLHGNISLGSSLAAGASQDYWLSPSGEFAFGFQQVVGGRGNSFLLAIWFNKIPQRTVVWSANRNELVPEGSTIKLTKDGNLILADPSGRLVWNPNSVGSGVSYGALLDTGNFVLAGRNSAVLWGSFDQPTDTILPMQTLVRGTELISKYSTSNYSTGRFKIEFQTDGNLVFYTTHYPQQGSNYAYYASSTFTADKLSYNQSGSLSITYTNGTILGNVFNSRELTKDFYQRVTIDSDGVVRQYVYPKRNNNNGTNMSRWPMEWTVSDFQPSNICTGIKGVIGNGACGLNSYCRMESGMFPRCDCPQGYVFKDPLDQSSGCVRNFAPQDCLVKEEGRRDDGGDRFDLVEMVNTDFPNGDYQILVSVSEDTCRGACLSDCLCDAALYRGGTCYKKRMPMSNGNVDLSNGGKTLFKVRRQNSTSSTTKKKDQLLLNATVGWFLLGSSIFVNIIFVLASCPWRKNPLNSKVGETLDQGALSSNLRRFAYKEMETATGGFKQVLGSGSSGTVYKGVINDHNSVLDKVHVMEGHDVREFTTEVTIIGETNHKNLTRLVGFCNEGQHRVLVYEFMSNGSLADFLFGGGETRPNWYTRTRIAYSVARGLVYLHEECNTPIIHCDIKPQNILLDCSMTARISDFGLSKLMKANQTRTTTAIRGTKGYLAPEWFRNVPVTPKVDVHSFGIVLLELVCCRKNFMMEVEKEEEMVLVDWAYDCYSKGKLHKLLGDDKDAMEDMVRVERLVKVSIWCIQEDPSLRPSMKKVVHMLEGAVLVSEPPDPNSFMSAI
ncbi:unnamed protein product [Linum tenue]|uniref:Receptor-like serine/threonine-protein kinase n=1 Tax=Linum tenue TaxID=586396 RepID=A0AAV0RE90_9ROSI|nr:unnamed protein product [Linum tenue]